MLLGGIYLGSVVAGCLLTIIADKDIKKRLDSEGYIDIGEDISTVKKVRNFLTMMIPGVMPIVGIILVFAHDSFYDYYKRDGLKKNTIIKKSDEIIEEESRIREEEKKKKIQKIIDDEIERKAKTQMDKPQIHVKSYSEMSSVEKLMLLEAERDSLLKQIEKDDQKTEEGPVKKRGTR